MLHLLRLSNHRYNFWYLYMMWSAVQTGHASSIGTSRKEQCLLNTADEIELPIFFREGFLSRRRNMRSSIIMQENNFVMPGVIAGAFFLECSAQSHQLCSIKSSNGLVRFEQLIIHDTKLIPPNTQHEFFSMNIRLGYRCWSMARLCPHDFLFFGLS